MCDLGNRVLELENRVKQLELGGISLTREEVVAFSRSNYNLPNIHKVCLDTSSIVVPDSEIVLIGQTSISRNIGLNSFDFNLGSNGFGLIYPGSTNDINKKSVSTVYNLSLNECDDIAVFNRIEVSPNDFIEGLIRTNVNSQVGYILQLEKVVNGVSTVLDKSLPSPLTPFGPLKFEMFADIDNNICGASIYFGNELGNYSLSSELNSFSQNVFNRVLIGFQSFDNVSRKARIFCPIVVTKGNN